LTYKITSKIDARNLSLRCASRVESVQFSDVMTQLVTVVIEVFQVT